MSDSMFQGFKQEDEGISTLRKFYEDENIEQKTELTKEEIGCILEAEKVNSYFKAKWGVDLGYDVITKAFKVHMVSNKRQGRNEAMEVLKAQREALAESKTNRGFMDRLMGR
jgi:uncharacterized hydantoinase/oxoprolinase family protein